VTQDNRLVVTHDRRVSPRVCRDTRPAWRRDREFPYVGDLVRRLTLRQLRTLDCGSATQLDLPDQRPAPGARIPTLKQVFALVRASGRRDVRLNIETKLSPLAPRATLRARPFARRLVNAIRTSRMTRRATIQSFDWRTIIHARRLDRRIRTVALVWQFGPAECRRLADECSLRPVYDDSTVKSPWTAGLDWWRVRDLGRLVRAARASTVSANWQVHDPNQRRATSGDWYRKEDPAYFHGPQVPVLRARGLRVVPYTINDEATMDRVIALGVDGIITDDHEALIRASRRAGFR
jgi:glycerophosphoryl diester phosphodiesterase